jgi:hemerythrin-like domain-containing protein
MSFEHNNTPNKDRYRLYREHKYIFYVFSEILQLTSSLDFSDKESTTTLKEQLEKLSMLLQSHAEYEESRIHVILKAKNSSLFEEAQEQHQDQKLCLEKLKQKIILIKSKSKMEDINFLGYEFYLDLRNFFCDNLKHFDYEESVIMPELQRLVSDEELKEIDRISYRQMSPEQLIDMMDVLFPHMNNDDRFVFLDEIKSCEPQKFELVYDSIFPTVE